MKFTRITDVGYKNTYDIRFKYSQVVRMGQAVGMTTCTVSLINPEIPKGKARYHCVSTGRVTQDTRDTFIKNEGRKRALAKALAPFPKDARTNAWEAYFAEVNAPHVNKKEYAAT